MKGLAGPLEPGVGAEKVFEHGGDQRFGLFLRAIGLLVDRRIIRTLCDCLTICTPNDVFSACEGARRRPSQPFPQGLPEDNG